MSIRLFPLLASLAIACPAVAQVTFDFATTPVAGLSGVDNFEVAYGATAGLSGGGALIGRLGTAPFGNMTNARVVSTTDALNGTAGPLSASVYFYFDPAVISSNNLTNNATDRFAAIGFKSTNATGASAAGPTAINDSVYAVLGGGRAGTSPSFTYQLSLRLGVRDASNVLSTEPRFNGPRQWLAGITGRLRSPTLAGRIGPLPAPC